MSHHEHRDHKREEVREAIFEAIGRLLKRLGYQKTTVEDIANEAGIGKGTVYLHFASKEDLALQWLERLHLEVMGEMRCIVASGRPPADRAQSLLVARVLLRYDRFADHSYSIEQMMATLKHELVRRRERFHCEEAHLLAGVLGELVGAPTESCLWAAEAMIVATNALLPYSLRVHDLGDRDTIHRKAADIAKLLVAGLAHPLPSHQP